VFLCFEAGAGAAGIILGRNVDAGSSVRRAKLWGTPSERDGLTLSQRGFASSLHSSRLCREKKSASSGSTLRFANSGNHFPTSITPSVHFSGTYESLNRIDTDFEQRVANQISLTCFCDFFFEHPVAIRASNFTRRKLAIGAVAHKQRTVVLGSSDHYVLRLD
jgi:hypothetical protein